MSTIAGAHRVKETNPPESASRQGRREARAPARRRVDEGQVQRRLADAIYEHRLPPGTKLPELELCAIFATTRNAIRSVFARLAADALLELHPNRGAFVARPSVKETQDVYQLRRILETGIIRCLAEQDRADWIEAIRAQVAAEREARRAGDNEGYIRLSGKFHCDLAAATKNAAVEQHLRRLVAQTSLMMALYDVPGTNACSFHEHLEILDAIEAREFVKAEQLMDEHLRGCERQLRLDVEARPVDLAQALGTAATSHARRAGNGPADGSGGESRSSARMRSRSRKGRAP